MLKGNNKNTRTTSLLKLNLNDLGNIPKKVCVVYL